MSTQQGWESRASCQLSKAGKAARWFARTSMRRPDMKKEKPLRQGTNRTEEKLDERRRQQSVIRARSSRTL